MRLNGRMQIQLALFTVIALVAMGLMTLHFMKLPAMLFDVGRYTVKVELPQTGGLYAGGNVTYRGTEVGRVDSVRLTPTGVEAVLSLKSGVDVPSDLRAEVHSQSAIGEQYVALLPRGDARPLRDGDVIPLRDTSVPPDVNTLLSDSERRIAGHPACESQDRHRRVLHGRRRTRPRAVADRQGFIGAGTRGARESRSVDHTHRSISARAGLADEHLRSDPGMGVEPGDGDEATEDP